MVRDKEALQPHIGPSEKEIPPGVRNRVHWFVSRSLRVREKPIKTNKTKELTVNVFLGGEIYHAIFKTKDLSTCKTLRGGNRLDDTKKRTT